MKPVIRNIIILTIVFVAVMLVRLFLVGSYRITGSTLGDTLKAGDYVFVNKLTGKKRDRNLLTLYKSPLQRDAANPPLFIGRCIGVPGDVIQMGVDGFRVNGRLLPNAPMMQPTFHINKNIKEPLLQTLESLQIPFRQMKEDSTGIILRMSLREKELLISNLSKVVPIEMIGDYSMEYEFVIPGKGKTIDLNEIVLMVCREAILREAGKTAGIRDGKLFIQGTEKTSYTFKNDYFWILSENETEGIDSRHLGLIPQDHIIGDIWFCWYSKDPANRFKRIK
jgi:signal peptidase I